MTQKNCASEKCSNFKTVTYEMIACMLEIDGDSFAKNLVFKLCEATNYTTMIAEQFARNESQQIISALNTKQITDTVQSIIK